MQEFFYPEEQSSLGSESLEPKATPRHTSPKGCSLGLDQLTYKSYQTYFGSPLAYGVYI